MAPIPVSQSIMKPWYQCRSTLLVCTQRDAKIEAELGMRREFQLLTMMVWSAVFGVFREMPVCDQITAKGDVSEVLIQAIDAVSRGQTYFEATPEN
jgi:hypothetical protein